MFNHQPKNYKCSLCVLAQGEETELNKQGDVVFEDEYVMAYVSPKWWVNNPGNVMIIPREHVENIYDISDALLCRVQTLGKKVAAGIRQTYECDGVSFRQHNEPAGGQDVWHFHLHIFPRWENDDLYSNHKKTRWVTSKERLPYAEKLKSYFAK